MANGVRVIGVKVQWYYDDNAANLIEEEVDPGRQARFRAGLLSFVGVKALVAMNALTRLHSILTGWVCWRPQRRWWARRALGPVTFIIRRINGI